MGANALVIKQISLIVVHRWRCSARCFVSAHVGPCPEAEAQTRPHTVQRDPCRLIGVFHLIHHRKYWYFISFVVVKNL